MHASASTLQLVTFDADGTLYADGAHMAQVCFFSHRKHVNAALTMKPGLPYLSMLRWSSFAIGLLLQHLACIYSAG